MECLIGVTGVVRARIDTVDRGSEWGHGRRQRDGDPLEGSLRHGIGNLFRHRTQMYAGSEQHDSANSDLGRRLDQEQGCSGVYSKRRIKFVCSESVQILKTGSSMNYDKCFETAER